ncbi:10964_t:CDS:1, partial [Scutellospora calospora]
YISNRKLNNSELANNRRNIEISIAEIEETAIQRVVKDKRLQIELSRIASELKEEKVLDIYIDRS